MAKGLYRMKWNLDIEYTAFDLKVFWSEIFDQLVIYNAYTSWMQCVMRAHHTHLNLHVYLFAQYSEYRNTAVSQIQL